NDAIRKSTADVIVFADADTYTTKGQVWAAVHIAAQTGNLTSAFEVILRQAEGADLWQECGDRFKNPPNGVVAISRPALDVVEIGRASCRESVSILLVVGDLHARM